MVILIYPNGEEDVILCDAQDKILSFPTVDEANEFRICNDLNKISNSQREFVIDLNLAEKCFAMSKLPILPDFVGSHYELGAGNMFVVDGASGEILSKKYVITFADAAAGYFVERIGDSLIEKKNSYVLHRNDNLEIIK